MNSGSGGLDGAGAGDGDGISSGTGLPTRSPSKATPCLGETLAAVGVNAAACRRHMGVTAHGKW